MQARQHVLAGRKQKVREANRHPGTSPMSPSHAVAAVPYQELGQIVSLVVNAVQSPQSKRAYKRSVLDFLAWYRAGGYNCLNKAVVQQYRVDLEQSGLASSSINLKLTGVRRLAAEAADNGLLAPELATGIARVKGVSTRGTRTGHWLTRAQVEELLAIPDAGTNKGRRDLVMLSLLVGCGLRRTELVQLTCEQIQQRDGRWVVANLRGKGNRLRTVPMPAWAKVVVDQWSAASGLASGPVLRAVNKSGRVLEDVIISPQSVYSIVRGYGVDMAVKIAPHDLRRTFAKLAHVGHAALEQIQLSLGHSSILTTERYLGVRQTLADAPCDHLGLNIAPPAENIAGRGN